MTTNLLKFRYLICLFAFSLGLTACSTKVGITDTGGPVFTKAMDLRIVEATYSKISCNQASPVEIEEYNRQARRGVTRFTRGRETGFQIDHSDIRNYDRIDRIKIADTITVKKGMLKDTGTCGVGVPLLARVKPAENDCFVPDDGYWIPITALVEPGNQCTTIRLVDPESASAPFPLATNFTAPLALDMYDRQKEYQRGKAVLNYDKFEPYMGIRRFFEFDPGKTPVVFIHGVFSSPTTWTNTINGLMADPETRNCFEFWTFGYPTGAPIPYLAQRLRDDVIAMHQFRKNNGAKCNNVILIGHSMGGLIAKTLTQHSGDKQWKRLFEVSPGSLDVSDEEEAVLRKMFYFKPLPFVDRVVFLATPHKGAVAVDKNFVKVVENFVSTPESLLEATQNVIHRSVNALTPFGTEVSHDFPNSIEHMRYGAEIGDLFADIPLNPAVKYHSIIANEEGDVPKEAMSDGFVDYTSAHIDGVVSEKITSSGHSVQNTEEGIAEIARILKSAR